MTPTLSPLHIPVEVGNAVAVISVIDSILGKHILHAGCGKISYTRKSACLSLVKSQSSVTPFDEYSRIGLSAGNLKHNRGFTP